MNLRNPRKTKVMLVEKITHHVRAEAGKTRYSSPVEAGLKGLKER